MGNQNSSDDNIIDTTKYSILDEAHLESLGILYTGLDLTSKKQYLILKTSYSIANHEITDSHISSLRNNLNSIKNSAQLISYSIKKDQMMCFDNYSIKLILEKFPKSLEVSG